MFNPFRLESIFADEIGGDKVVVYGEAYGGKQQGMSKTYGPDLRFIVFDVLVDDCWLSVPKVEDICIKLGLEMVAYAQTSTELDALDAERDKPSTQAVRNGIADTRLREGVVLRPLIEVVKNNGKRVIAKHKRAEFRERKSIPQIDPAKRELMEKAISIADEWVTPMRLNHVLDKMGNPEDISATGEVIKAMIEDVCREAEGMIADNKSVRKAIGAVAAKLFKAKLMSAFRKEGK